MDPGPRDYAATVSAGGISWMRAAFVWMLTMIVETGHGAVREVFIAPVLGDLRARQLGVLVGSLIVLAIAWLFRRWWQPATRGEQLAIGAFWLALTLVFEFSLGRATGVSWSRLLSDYDPAQGGFMLLGVAVMFFAPRWVSTWSR